MKIPNSFIPLLFVFTSALSSFGVMAEEQISSRSFESDKVYLDTLTFRIGSTNAMIDTANVNGGVIGINEPDDSGINYNLTAVFSNGYAPKLKPYLELGRVAFDDRNYNMAGGGVRYDLVRQTERLGFYVKGGAGFIFSNWTESPFNQPSAGLAGDDSFMLSLQGGADYYFADHWAVDLSLRYDIYDLETTIIEASNTNASTTWNEKNAVSLLVGIVYQFQSGLTKIRFSDADGDGVIDKYDRCKNTFEHVKVDNSGCMLTEFDQYMHFQNATFRMKHLTYQPYFQFVEFMNSYPEYNVALTSCANYGSGENIKKESNFTGSLVQNYLLNQGVDGTRITVQGAAEPGPVHDGDAKNNNSIVRCVNARFYVFKDFNKTVPTNTPANSQSKF